MAKKVDDIYKDLYAYLKKFQDAVDDRTAAEIAYTVKQRMLNFISKGISPIEGVGRFPEYKAPKDLRGIQNSIRAARASGSAGRNKAVLGRLAQKKSSAKRGYPYSTEEYKKGEKKARPVNLWLTGKFLTSLTYGVGKAGGAMRIAIGFFDPKEAIKEKGHREGANGQAKRPIIPRPSERFNQTIRLDIMRLLKDAVRKATKRAG